jgi:CBS domain containing-hemolysin-like protein
MGLLPPFQETVIHRALELDEVSIREIMTPRQKIFSLPSNMPLEEASARVIDRKHSRVPVYDESRGPEHIVGVVYSKDLSRLMYFRPRSPGAPAAAPSLPKSLAAENWESKTPRPTATPFAELKLGQVMRDVLVVPETKSVLDLIRDFQQRRRHFAIVVDEYGSTVGLVTAEDAIEQLTGEFEDEFDSPALPVLTTASGALLMDGGVNLRDLETQMQWRLPREGGVETLAGFLLMRLGHIPEPGESVVFESRRLTVAEMDGRRIAKVRVEQVKEE